VVPLFVHIHLRAVNDQAQQL